MRKFFKKIRSYLSKEILYLTIAILSYILYKEFSHHSAMQNLLNSLIFHVNLKDPEQVYYVQVMTWFLTSFLYLFVVPLGFTFLIKKKKTQTFLGLKFSGQKKGVLIVLIFTFAMWIVMIPVVKIFPSFRHTYPFAKFILHHPLRILFYEVSYFFFFVGWEFFSHGFLLFPYEKKFGKSGAILIGLMPFAIMHIGKPMPEVIGSIIAGLALSILALETRTFWYGVLLHGIVAISMDLIIILFR